jgi:hypothetical protein
MSGAYVAAVMSLTPFGAEEALTVPEMRRIESTPVVQLA